jgi:hypothetical protein
MSVLWTIIIGFIAGVIAKFIMPGDNEPSGFILQRYWESSVRSWRPNSGKLLDGIVQAKGQA